MGIITMNIHSDDTQPASQEGPQKGLVVRVIDELQLEVSLDPLTLQQWQVQQAKLLYL